MSTSLFQTLRRIKPTHVIKTSSVLSLLYVLISSYQLYLIDSALLFTTPPAMTIFAIAGVCFAWYFCSINRIYWALLGASLAIAAAAIV